MRFFEQLRDNRRFESLLSWKKLVFPTLTLLVVPFTVAYAGIWSDAIGRIGSAWSSPILETRNVNSQNYTLLAYLGGDTPGDTGDIPVVTVGESAMLADSGPEGSIADIDDSFDHGHISLYVVREGDSFSSIAEMFDVSVNTILWANDLPRGSRLTVGQTLTILPVSGIKYVVKKGDTVVSIAKKHKGDADEIYSFNDLTKDTPLSVGTTIIIPDGEMPTVVSVTRSVRPATLRGTSGPYIPGYYSPPLAVMNKSQGLHGYNGFDFRGAVGTPVFASADGKVIVSRQGGYNGGYGSYVVLQHGNGTQTLYAHLRSTAVSVGEQVWTGETIGYLGNTGRSTGPHLHFEVRGARNPF